MVVAESDHGLTCYSLDLMVRIHSLCTQKPCSLVYPSKDLLLATPCQQGCNKASQAQANFLTFLDRPGYLSRLLFGTRTHDFRQMGDSIQILRTQARDKSGEDIGESRGQVRCVLNQAAQNLHCEFSTFLRLIF